VPLPTECALIAMGNPLARSGPQRGPVAPCKDRDAVQRVPHGDRNAAGQISPSAALLVSHDDFSSLPPRASRRTRFGSVKARSAGKDTV
jgi:hypothetical protein